MTDFRDRYKRAVLDFIGAPEGVDLETVSINFSWDEGYHYSEYTYEDPHLDGSVSYVTPVDNGWYKAGERVSHGLDAHSTIKLMNSFGDLV